MGIEKRLLASLSGAWMAFSLTSPSAAVADTSGKSASPLPRPSVSIKARPAAKPANAKSAAQTTSKSSKHLAAVSSKAPAGKAATGKASLSKTGKATVAKTARLASASGVHHSAVAPEHVKAAVASTADVRSTRGRLWCVPFAREVTGINLQGNAKNWWSAAENRYAKGKTPVVGSVLNFRATNKMPMGHVAVVSQVVNSRKILVDHANWRKNRVSLNMAVVDVSPRNDWSAVRVESGPNTLGDVYPTYGFIYRAADNG